MALVVAAHTAAAQTFSKQQATAVAVPADVLASASNKEQIERGGYLARAADCTACHTRTSDEPYAGGVAFSTPFGSLYAPNISSDPEHGIGDWSEAEFRRALKQGIAKGGVRLYPAMPYTAYTRLTDQDIAALWAYFQQVEPQDQPNKENELTWPFSWRIGMWFWNVAFFDEGSYEPDSSRSRTWNRGAYLVEGAGHCSSCHTPRNFAMAENTSESYSGAVVQGWHAPSLLSDENANLADWSVTDITQYLKIGYARDNASTGPMSEAIHNSLQYLDHADLHAMAVYIKSLRTGDDGSQYMAEGVAPSDGKSRPPADSNGPRAGHISEARASIGTADGRLSAGERLYIDNCQACHLQGQGMHPAFPALVDNSAVNGPNPTNVIHVILNGAQNVQTQHDPSILTMPNFDWRLNNAQVATLATYVRSTFGKLDEQDAQVTQQQVEAIRTAEAE